MRYTVGRALEMTGMAVVLVGLVVGVSYWGSPNAIKYEVSCLVAGVGLFYMGHWLRTAAEKGP